MSPVLLSGASLCVSFPAPRPAADGEANRRGPNVWLCGSWRRNRRRVLSDVSVDVRAGECLAVTGESGSGKTTLIRALLGIGRLDRGTVSYRGMDVRPGSAGLHALRAESSIVFQDPFSSLDPRWPIGRSVAEPLTIRSRRGHGHASVSRGDVRRRVREALTLVDLYPDVFFCRFPMDLSGGQAQRAAIARAIVGRPRVLVADEPMSAVDVVARVRILHILERVRERMRGGMTLIIVSHDLGVVQRIADVILVLRRGSVVERGPADHILREPSDPYTKRLIAAASW